jgi:hypothetical protein
MSGRECFVWGCVGAVAPQMRSNPTMRGRACGLERRFRPSYQRWFRPLPHHLNDENCTASIGSSLWRTPHDDPSSERAVSPGKSGRRSGIAGAHPECLAGTLTATKPPYQCLRTFREKRPPVARPGTEPEEAISGSSSRRRSAFAKSLAGGAGADKAVDLLSDSACEGPAIVVPK